jgi:hypothetical protein
MHERISLWVSESGAVGSIPQVFAEAAGKQHSWFMQCLLFGQVCAAEGIGQAKFMWMHMCITL